MFFQGSQPFTSIYNNPPPSDKKPVSILLCHLDSSNKESLLKSFETFKKIDFHCKPHGQLKKKCNKVIAKI